jgi:hypothetical protein
MHITRLLILVSTMLWGLPSLAVPVAKPVACACKIQPTPTLTSWVDPFPDPLALRFSPQTAEPPTWSPEAHPDAQHQRIAEGSPAEDKGTPGNRGQCPQGQCTSQAPSTHNAVVSPK